MYFLEKCVLFLLTIVSVNCTLTLDPQVNSNVGLIRGLRATDGDYSMFRGIPYAKVNETNPFGASTPYPKFEKTFEAYNDTAICPQENQGVIIGSLDCLHLNVFVPNTASSNNRLPVMVFLHGGGFMTGFSSSYGPKYLVQHDVILVTLTYRLGPYGFMCLDIPEVPGNQGIKDQLLAMKWVKNNIEAFGGDVDRITLFGQSAGGHSIDLYLTSSKELLYNRVILQSGSDVAATVLYEPDKLAPFKLAQHLGFETNDIMEALSFLTASDIECVIEAGTYLDMKYKPCVELEFDGVEPFITYNWVDAKSPKVKDVPVLLGFNEHEMAKKHVTASEYDQVFNLISTYMNRTFEFDDITFEEMRSLIAQFYFGDDGSEVDLMLEAINFDSDYTYIHPVKRTISKYLESNAKKIFYYMFSYLGGKNVLPNFASHEDELSYIFNINTAAENIPQDEIIINRMTTMWTNFAKYGDPTPETTDLLPVKWLPLVNESYYYLRIDSQLTLSSRPLHQRMAFWDLFYKHNEKSQKFITK